jgi:hypothetical protein
MEARKVSEYDLCGVHLTRSGYNVGSLVDSTDLWLLTTTIENLAPTEIERRLNS